MYIDEQLLKQAEETLEKPYRDRAELYALQGGKIYGSLYDNGGFGTYGGGIDSGEDGATAAAREFAEEAGYNVHNVKPLPFKPNVLNWEPPFSTESQRRRAEQFKGSRTFYFAGELGEPIPNVKLDELGRTAPGLYSIEDAIATIKLNKADELYRANKRRKAILAYLQKQVAVTQQKTAESLYHGSPQQLSQIEPRPSRVIDNESAVFATPHREVALSFLAPWRDEDFTQGSIDGEFYMSEKYPGAFDKRFKGRSGYLHQLAAEGFKSDPRLTNYEQISDKAVTPISAEYIEDLLTALKNQNKIKLQFQAPERVT